MECVTSLSNTKNLFVKGVHHLHLSVLYINQNFYCKGKHSRTINLNTHIYVLMKNPRDVSQIQCLARQAFLGKCSFLMEAYEDATSQPYGYWTFRQEQKRPFPCIPEYLTEKIQLFTSKHEEISVAALRQISAFVVWNARE